MENEEKIINILTDIFNEQKKMVAEMTDLKNLFLRYDLEAQFESEVGNISED